MRRIVFAFVLAAAVLAVGVRPIVTAQDTDLGAARVSHVGMVVPDLDAALKQAVGAVGFTAPKNVMAVPVPLPDGRKTQIKVVWLRFPNFYVEFVQPVDKFGPYYEHLQNRGVSIQHVGLAMPEDADIDAARTALEQKGGQWVLGDKGGGFAYVSFEPTLGATFELVRGNKPMAEPPPSVQAGVLSPLAALPVGHVGFAATDTAAATKQLASVFGIPTPSVMDYKDAQYPSDSKWNRSAYLRLAFLTHGPIGVEVIESVGKPTPWSESVELRKGTAPQHIAINVGDRMEEMIKALSAKGGKWTNGKPGGAYAYLDFTDTLGLIFELNGTTTSAGSK